VVEDTVYTSVRRQNHPMVFAPMTQHPAGTNPSDKYLGRYVGAVVLQTARPTAEMESIVRRTLAAMNPNLTVVKFQTFDRQIADQFIQERLVSRLMMIFGGLALLLAAVGLYGVTAYTVVRRTQEIGIRMALGADRAGVVAMILRGALVQILIGLAIGVPVTLLCVRFVRRSPPPLTVRAHLGVVARRLRTPRGRQGRNLRVGRHHCRKCAPRLHSVKMALHLHCRLRPLPRGRLGTHLAVRSQRSA